MKKGVQRVAAGLICAMALFFTAPPGFAFETIELADQELTVYGFLRNNTGYFMDEMSYQQNDDKLGTFRTTLRVHADWKINKKLKAWAVGQLTYEPDYDMDEGSETPGMYYCEYNDFDDVFREGYIEWIPNKKTDIKIGRQIAIWGESMTTRVGDVIHPEDQRWTMAFANIEDTRIPQWMIRGIHDIDDISSSFEWIVNPLIVDDEYKVHRQAEFALPIAHTSGQRFGLHPEDRHLPPNAYGNPVLFPDAPGVAGPPFSRSWIPFPVPVGHPLSGTYIPTDIPHVSEKYPDDWDGTRFGFRTSTYSGGYQFGFLFWHTHNFDPLVEVGELTGAIDPGTGNPIRNYYLVHPSYEIYGFYMNKQLPWPGIVRAEAIYSPNKPFNTFDLNDADAITERDYVKYMVAYDLNGFLFFDWHKTAPFDITFEHVGEWVPDNDDIQYVIYATEQPSYIASFNMRVSTNWFYNRLATDIVVSYSPFGDSGLIMPSAKYTPGWMNKSLSFELKYINVFGDNDYEGLGMLREKDMIVFTTQFDF